MRTREYSRSRYTACAEASITYYAKEEISNIKRLGNFWDERKELAEPLKHFRAGVHEFYFDMDAAHSHAPIHIAGNWHTPTEAKVICMKLRRLIFTYEQDGAL